MRVIVVCYLRPDCWLDRFILTDHSQWIDWQSGSQEELLSTIEEYNKCIRPLAVRKGRRAMEKIVVCRSSLNGYSYRHFVGLWHNAYVVEQLLLPKLIQGESASNLWVVCKVKSPPIYLDLRGNDKIMTYMHQRLELEHASWCLSTFGGAFSAYGDYFYEFAVKAGEISTTQLRIAILLGNELLVSRCRLYYALSLIQQRKLRLAKRIIRHEYAQWSGVRQEEGKLIRNICLGTWSRLKVEKRRHG
ncbi:hypothetical protein D918_02703 [Trichuris suis]|nr:hypothetical protein D918_02703 [Trichuris suis]